MRHTKWIVLGVLAAAAALSACSSEVTPGRNGPSTGSATLLTGCGDGVLDPEEQCDDGNTSSGDGCSDKCEFEGDVCMPRETPGADDETVVACVCGLDPYCCETAWDAICVGEAISDCGVTCPVACGNGILEEGEECDDGNTTDGDGCDSGCKFDGDVCTPHASPGANDSGVVACVCALDSFCCEVEWDSVCVATAIADCNAPCTCGNGVVDPGEDCDDGNLDDFDGCSATCHFEGSACVPRETPGAEDPAVTACVCDLDSSCCSTEWSTACVDLAIGSCGHDCGDPCTPHPTPGTNDTAVTECVCAFDSFCCEIEWDDICVEEGRESCGAGCPAAASVGNAVAKSALAARASYGHATPKPTFGRVGRGLKHFVNLPQRHAK